MATLRGVLLAALVLASSILSLSVEAMPDAPSPRSTWTPSPDHTSQVEDNPTFQSAFPSYSLVAVDDVGRVPPIRHHTAVRADGSGAFDVTADWNRLMADAGAISATPSSAIAYAKAYATTALIEHVPARDVVDASSASALGMAISSPAASAGIGTWVVTLTTWSRVGGAVADWTITLEPSRLREARMDVRAVGAGNSSDTWETPNLRVGDSLRAAYNGFVATTRALARTGATPSRRTPAASSGRRGSCAARATATGWARILLESRWRPSPPSTPRSTTW